MDAHFVVAPAPTANLDIACSEVPPGDTNGLYNIGCLAIEFFDR